MSYTDLQQLWYQELSIVGTHLIIGFLALVAIKLLLGNPRFFKLTLFLIFLIPLTMAELLTMLRS